MWNRTPGFLYNHCKIKLNSGVNIFTFSTLALHFLSFMMNYVVWLTLFPNLKVLVLAEILDLPCPNIFNRKGASQKWHNKTKWFSSWFCLIILHENKQGKSGGFDSCDQPSNLTETWFKSLIFSPYDLEIWWMTLKNNRAPSLGYINICALFQSHQWIQTGVTIL